MQLPAELFLALRYLRPKRSTVSIITLLSVAGVTIGVAALIVVVSVVSGFQSELTDKILGFNAHVIVTRGSFFSDYDETLKQLRAQPEVTEATPYVEGPVMANMRGMISTPIVRGLPISEDEPNPTLAKQIVQGELELRGDSVIVGRVWADRYNAAIGDTVIVYSPSTVTSIPLPGMGNGKIHMEGTPPEPEGPPAPTPGAKEESGAGAKASEAKDPLGKHHGDKTAAPAKATPPAKSAPAKETGGKARKPGAKSAPAEEPPPAPPPAQPSQDLVFPSEMTITGFFDTGYRDFDDKFFIVSLENAQRFYKLDHAVHALQVRIKEPMNAQEFTDRMNRQWDDQRPLAAESWIERNRPIFNALVTERFVIALLVSLVSLVAAFGVCNTLITLTAQKYKEIGVLKAMGAHNGMIRSIFALHGLIVGLIGSIVGSALGYGVLMGLNPTKDFIQRTWNFDAFNAEVYNLPHIPMKIDPEMIFLVIVGCIVLCVLAALIPAASAASIDPAKALRNE